MRPKSPSAAAAAGATSRNGAPSSGALMQQQRAWDLRYTQGNSESEDAFLARCAGNSSAGPNPARSGSGAFAKTTRRQAYAATNVPTG